MNVAPSSMLSALKAAHTRLEKAAPDLAARVNLEAIQDAGPQVLEMWFARLELMAEYAERPQGRPDPAPVVAKPHTFGYEIIEAAPHAGPRLGIGGENWVAALEAATPEQGAQAAKDLFLNELQNLLHTKGAGGQDAVLYFVDRNKLFDASQIGDSQGRAAFVRELARSLRSPYWHLNEELRAKQSPIDRLVRRAEAAISQADAADGRSRLPEVGRVVSELGSRDRLRLGEMAAALNADFPLAAAALRALVAGDLKTFAEAVDRGEASLSFTTLGWDPVGTFELSLPLGKELNLEIGVQVEHQLVNTRLMVEGEPYDLLERTPDGVKSKFDAVIARNPVVATVRGALETFDRAERTLSGVTKLRTDVERAVKDGRLPDALKPRLSGALAQMMTELSKISAQTLGTRREKSVPLEDLRYLCGLLEMPGAQEASFEALAAFIG